MNREEKSAAIQEIAVQIEGAEAIFAVDYRGITVSQAAELRSKLRETDASFRVVKNRLTKIAANQVGEERLPELLVGPTALTFVRGDTAAAAKAITTFNKEHDVLTFKGGFMEDIVLDEESFKAIAKLPSREVLIGQLAGVVASPLTGLVRGLGALIGGLALQLGQIAEKGLVTGEAPAAKDESAAAAGPVADETSAASSAEDPSSAPPAADAESADAETPAAEEKADESSSDNEASEAEGETADADDNTAKEEEE